MNREMRRQLKVENAKWPVTLREVPFEEWPASSRALSLRAHDRMLRVFRSRRYLVQVFEARTPALVRLTVNRTSHNGERWVEDISWDDLQRLKAEAGYADSAAVEIFPPERDVVNVANMRHLWVLADPPTFMWRN